MKQWLKYCNPNLSSDRFGNFIYTSPSLDRCRPEADNFQVISGEGRYCLEVAMKTEQNSLEAVKRIRKAMLDAYSAQREERKLDRRYYDIARLYNEPKER